MTGPEGNSSFCFPRISILFSSAAPRGNIEIRGKQNELFPSGPVIKCLLTYSINCTTWKDGVYPAFSRNGNVYRTTWNTDNEQGALIGVA